MGMGHFGQVAGWLVLVAGVSAGITVARWLGAPGWLAATAAGLGVAGIGWWGAALAGLAFPAVAWAGIAAGLVALTAPGTWRTLADAVRNTRLRLASAGPGQRAIVAGGTALAALYWVLALVPPTTYDSLAYHLVLPQQAAFAHKAFGMEYFLPSAFPFAVPGLSLWAMLLGGGWRGPSLINWAFAPLSALAVGRAAAGACTNPLAGPGAATAWLLIPLVAITGTTPLTDLATSFYALLGVAEFLAWWREGGRRRVALAGVWCGLAGACKYSGGLLVLPMAAAVLLRRGTVRARARRALALGAGAAIPVLPVLARNALFAGAPFFPYLTAAVQAGRIHRWNLHLFGIARDPLSALALPFRLAFDWQAVLVRDIGQAGGSLLALYAAPLLALAPWAARPGWRRSRDRWLALSAAGLYALTFAAGWPLRYLLPVMGMCTVLWITLADGWRRGPLLVLGLYLACAVPHAEVVGPFRDFLRAAGNEDRYLRASRYTSHLYPALAAVAANAPPGARVLPVFFSTVYYADRRMYPSLMHDRSLAERILTASRTPASMARLLRQRGVSHLLVARSLPGDMAGQYLESLTREDRDQLRAFTEGRTVLRYQGPAVALKVFELR